MKHRNPPNVVAELCEEAVRLRWVEQSASRFAKTKPRALVARVGGVAEMVSVGETALFDAATGYDPAKRASFKTYQFRVVWWQLIRWWDWTLKHTPEFYSIEEVCRGEDREEDLQIPDYRERPIDPAALDLPVVLRRLNKLQRHVIRQHYWHGKDFTEIGRARGVSREHIRQQHQRGLAKLRDAFTGEKTYKQLLERRAVVRRRYDQKKAG